MEHYAAALALNARLIDTAIEFWTAMTFPSLYLAKRL